MFKFPPNYFNVVSVKEHLYYFFSFVVCNSCQKSSQKKEKTISLLAVMIETIDVSVRRGLD